MAGNAHLTEDRIDWTLTLNANEAEQKLHSLSTETKQLKDRQKELNQELKQAQVHPRKNAEQIRLLKEQLKECSSSIKHNGEEMKKLDRQMGVSNLSMSQLRRHASDLRKELDSISKSYHPEEWEKINRELVDTKNRIRELNEESAVFRTKDAVEATTLGNLLSDTITSITGKMRELIAEGVEMAESADGVQRAFNKLDKPGLLDNLRKATKGTVNDLQLMQAAVRAKDFRIPLEDLGKYLAYAQLKAQETGQSVEYLTDSIIMGLGRQSKQILDNLGLSAAEIGEEVAKTGDFVSGVTAIVDRQLAEAGDTYVSASDRAAQASVALKNAQLQLGQAMLPVKEVMNGMSLAGTKLISFLVKYRQITFPLIAALTSLYLAKAKFNTVTRLGTVLIKAQNAVLATQKVVVLAASAAYNLMTGNITRCKAAIQLLGKAIMANPIGLIATAIAAVTTTIFAFHRSTVEATESLSVMERVSKRVADSEDKRADHIRELVALVHDETRSYDDRNKALTTLKGIVPDYHASLTKEGKLIGDNTDAIQAYIKMLETEAETLAYAEEKKELYRRQAQLTLRQQHIKGLFTDAEKSPNVIQALKLAKEAGDIEKELAEISSDLTFIDEKLKKADNQDGARTESLIDELKKRRKEVELWSEATEEQIAIKNRELEKIDDEITRLNNLGKAVRTTSNIIEESHDDLLADQQRLDDATRDSYQQLLNEKHISQEEFDAYMAMAAVRSAEARLKIEQEQAEKISAMSFKTAQERVKAEETAGKRIADAEHALSEARIKEQQTLNKNIDQLIKSGAKGREVSLAEEREIEMQALDVCLKAALAMIGDDQEKSTALWEAYWDSIFRVADKYSKKEKDLKTAARKNSGLFTPQEQLQEELANLKDALDKKYITEEEYQKKSLQLTIENEKARRDAAGLSTYKQDLQLRLMALKEALDQGLLMENEYNAKVRDAKISSWKEQFDYWSNLASNAFESLQQAEIDNSAAKYDVLISQAKKAGQDTAALEEKKEAKQLEIQKKYADVNFAIKASQIIADTAVSIMKARADLGPIAGSIAAALTAVVGAAQLASANAERERVKQLQAGSAGATGGTRVLTGHEKGGYIDVRRRQDGRLFRNVEVDPSQRGYIDRPTVIVGEGARSKEWVASNAAVENPTVSPILDIIDRAQRAGSIRTLDLNKVIRSRLTGYADGGDIASSRHPRRRQRDTADTVAIPDSGISTLEHLDETLRSLQRDGIPASVTLTELDRKRELRDRARKIGSKR